MPKDLFAIVSPGDGGAYEETCLCSDHYMDENQRTYYELNYTKPKWMKFSAQLKNPEYAEMVCTVCGYPIGSNAPPDY